MGETAETLVREYGILRAEQDAYAAESQRRAADAAGMVTTLCNVLSAVSRKRRTLRAA